MVHSSMTLNSVKDAKLSDGDIDGQFGSEVNAAMGKSMDISGTGFSQQWANSWRDFCLVLWSHGENHGQFSKRGFGVMGKIMDNFQKEALESWGKSWTIFTKRLWSHGENHGQF